MKRMREEAVTTYFTVTQYSHRTKKTIEVCQGTLHIHIETLLWS